MKRPMFKRVFPMALAWVAVIALCGVIALAQNAAPAAGQRTDGQIEMDVVHALDAAQALKNDLITAATIQSQVTLAGTVSSEDSKKLAESIVKGVPGVTGVKNNLKVGNPADQQNLPAAQGSQGTPTTAGNQPYGSCQTPAAAPNQGNVDQGYEGNGPPDYGQNQAPGYGQNPQNGYGQNQNPNYGQNQYPDQYSGQQGPYRQQYAPEQPRRPAYQLPSGPMTVPQGTLLQVRTSEPVSSKRAAEGTPVQFTVIQDVTLGGVLAIPRGATVHGVVTGVRRAGELAGKPELALQLTSLDLSGRNYPIQSDEFRVRGPNKAGRTAGNVFGGALLGAIIGGAAGGGPGAAIGAVAGGGVGTAASAASSGPSAWIPSEALVSFHLMSPVTVNPVSGQEAEQLGEGLNQGGPSLHQRGYRQRPYGYGGGYGYPVAYPYAYPYGGYAPVYYRPYFYSGGFYYWR
jgi:hypothetical protein